MQLNFINNLICTEHFKLIDMHKAQRRTLTFFFGENKPNFKLPGNQDVKKMYSLHRVILGEPLSRDSLI